MSYIYLVILTAGYSCCDMLHRTLRGFTDKADAETYMKDVRHQISRNMGLRHAMDQIMTEWDKVNVIPPCPPNEGEGAMEAYNAWCEVDNAHRDARSARFDYLGTLLGWRRDIYTGWEEEYDLHIQDVPLGFEVKEGGFSQLNAAE